MGDEPVLWKSLEDREHVHRGAGVPHVVHDGGEDGVVAGLRGDVVAPGDGELIEVAVYEDVVEAHVDDDDLRGEGFVKVLCNFKFILFSRLVSN